LSPWEEGELWITVALIAALLVKLCWSRLVYTYRILFCYLTADFLSSIGALTIPYDTKRYGDFYFSSQTVKIVLGAFVLVEIYTLALAGTPALARFGRNMVSYILGAAALFPVVGVLMDHATSRHPYLRAFLLFEQTMDGTMAIFLIIISIFMGWFPVRMRRNVIVYIGGFLLWALSRSAAAHIVNQWSGNTQVSLVVSSMQMFIEMGCLLLWLLELRREGESRTAVVGHLWNRAEAERLTDQLDAINSGLERLRRK
jgi:hypothetical protein